MATKPDSVEFLAFSLGLSVGRWAPGDGQARYRFFQGNGTPFADYDSGDGIFTALGRGQALTFLAGFNRGYSHALYGFNGKTYRANLGL